MKLTKFALLAVAALASVAISTRAADTSELFPNNQLTLDVSGVYQKTFPTFGSQFDSNWRHGDFGGDVGVDYWLMKYVGVGVDTWGLSKGQLLHDIDGNLFLRMPISGSPFAPYIFGGVGHYFDTDNMFEDCGAGVQIKFNRHMGFFADWRYLYTEKAPNSVLARVGLQFGF